MLAIAGPTACNKSHFAMQLAERCGGEIISVDSGSVYCGMDIGTAKPPAVLRARIPHHVVDVCAPDEVFHVGRFCELAHAAVQTIQSRRRVPLFVGGSMMYYRTFIAGLYDCPPVSLAVRKRVRLDVQQRGVAAMHAELAKLDAAAAAAISPGDAHRVSRALEVLAVGGIPAAAWRKTATADAFALQFILLIPTDRARLRQAIGERLEGMFAAGLLNETQTIIRQFKLPAESASLRLAGYRQSAAHLRGEYDEAEMRRRAYYATCQLAKRQLTWLRSWQKPLAIIDPFADNAESLILQAVEKAL